MTVYCVEVMASSDVNAENVKNKIADLKSKYGEKMPKQDVEFSQSDIRGSNLNYYDSRIRFTLSESSKITEKNDITEQIRKEMDMSASWWQLRWHECTNYQEIAESCTWEYQNDSGNIPTEVSYGWR